MVRLRAALFALLAACGASTAPARPAPPVAATPAAPPTMATAQAAYDAGRWAACAEQFLAVAHATPKSHPDLPLYNAACCYARAAELDLAFATLDASIAAGYSAADRTAEDTDFVALHGDARWPGVLDKMRAAHVEPTDPQLRTDLLARFDVDQAARNEWIAAMKIDPKAGEGPIADKVHAIDRENTEALKAAVARAGWPGKSAVGEEAAHAAWLLVQHTADRAFQRDALAKMEPLVATGEVTAADYAYLYDRIAVADHRPQRYGTQYKGDQPQPIEDEAHVDERRKAVGLGTMAEYRADMIRVYGASLKIQPAPKK